MFRKQRSLVQRIPIVHVVHGQAFQTGESLSVARHRRVTRATVVQEHCKRRHDIKPIVDSAPDN